MADIIESFWLYGKDGSPYWAHVYEDRINTSTLTGLSSIPGARTARLQNGDYLNFVDENTFVNVATGELLSRKGRKA